MLNNSQRIIIVGAGPTGATLALLLARFGIASTLIERRNEPQSHPAASILNTRTMEIFRELNINTEIMSDCQDVFSRSNIHWVTNLNGRSLGQLSAVQEDLDQQLSLSPCHAIHYPQHRLEPKLWERVRGETLVDFRCGCSVLAMNEEPSRAVVTVHGTPSGENGYVSGSYVVACDGADSRLRQSRAIEFTGPLLQNMMGVHFEADLGKLVDHRPAILYWIFHPDVMGVLIAHWIPTEWVLFFPYFPPQQSVEQFTEDVIREKVFAAIGSRDIPDLQLHKTLPWEMTSKLAAQFRHGRLFLAGDAAHTFPPTGGLGLNSGVQDAHNLAWKLAAVLRGESNESLLDSYETERRPVAEQNLNHSTNNYLKMNELTQVVGLDFRHLDWLRQVQQSKFFRALPNPVQRALLERALQFAMRRLRRFEFNNRAGQKARARFTQRVPGQVSHYRCLGLDLGFHYENGAVFGGKPVIDDCPDHGDVRVTRYASTIRLGGRLPHIPVTYFGQSQSLLDLVPTTRFRLFALNADKRAWEATLEQSLTAHLMAHPAILSIGTESSANIIDDEERWKQLVGDDVKGVLVRPDGHIAWLPTCIPEQLPREFYRIFATESTVA